ncbi:MAG: hypothetical protein ACI8P0_002876 [Planctomycetaceae bacterium]|jgi:hypothetical protein
MSQYEHTQRSPLHLMLMAVAGILAGQAVIAQQEQPARIVLLCVAALFIFLAACFAELTVRDEGERLVLRYGPLPLFGWTFFWNDIESAEAGRTSWIDGWGIHWIPGRGTTFNLWGFDCVLLRVKGKVVRIGTDDAKALAQFIRSKRSLTPPIEGEDRD